MQKKALVIILCVGYIITGYSQDKEKIKGDRNVTIKETKINPFNRIIVGEDLKIDIIEGPQASIFVETDDNLHDIIKFDVIDSTLTFNTSQKITSSKKMNIKVMYTQVLKQIETFEDGEISSLTSLNLHKIILKNTGSSKAFLNIKTKDFSFVNSDRAKVKLNVSTEKANLELAENSNVDALIHADTLNVDLYQKADAKIEGLVKHLKVRADNSTKFIGKDLTASTAEVLCESNSDVSVQVTNTLNIEVIGSGEVYIYADPKISLNKFSDTAKLYKKEMKN